MQEVTRFLSDHHQLTQWPTPSSFKANHYSIISASIRSSKKRSHLLPDPRCLFVKSTSRSLLSVHGANHPASFKISNLRNAHFTFSFPLAAFHPTTKQLPLGYPSVSRSVCPASTAVHVIPLQHIHPLDYFGLCCTSHFWPEFLLRSALQRCYLSIFRAVYCMFREKWEDGWLFRWCA